jgi:tetratricopeptide (TPR) repeat protein
MRLWFTIFLVLYILPAYSQVTETQPQVVFSAIKDTDQPIEVQMETAREALRNNDFDTAITILNTVLLLPNNRFTQEAQARIGFAYERSKKYSKAIGEYNAYIAMYPKSGIVESMRRRLLALEILTPQHDVAKAIPDGPRQIKEHKVEVSSSTYYIASGTDSTLISNVHANGVFKDNEYTTKIALRENVHTDIKPVTQSKYTLNTATVEVENSYRDWELKLGRQNADYGVMSKFDGVTATYGYGHDTEYTLVLGQPLMNNATSSRKMYGIHSHFNLSEFTSATVYYNHQTADSFEERSALGSEFRYFKEALSATAAAEYDMAYRQLNAVTLQAHKDSEANRWFVLYDHRKSPVLYADKALALGLFNGANMPYNSVAEALIRSGMSASELRDYIVSETAVSSSFAIGGAIAVNTWTVGGDIQSATMSGTGNEPQSSVMHSISVNAFNPKAFANHSLNGIVTYTTSENGMYSLTVLDSTEIAKIRVDTTARITNKQNKLLSFSTHHKLSKDAFLELQLMLTKIREEIDRTFILGFRYEF